MGASAPGFRWVAEKTDSGAAALTAGLGGNIPPNRFSMQRRVGFQILGAPVLTHPRAALKKLNATPVAYPAGRGLG